SRTVVAFPRGGVSAKEVRRTLLLRSGHLAQWDLGALSRRCLVVDDAVEDLEKMNYTNYLLCHITERPTFLQYINATPKLSNKTTMAPLFSLLEVLPFECVLE
ncbi:unnamed protein product, partial [Amoebophrya sp. A25]